MGSAVRKARFRQERTLTHDTNEYVFDMVDPPELRFQPGQFISLACGQREEGKLERRSYSLASSPRDGSSIALVVKHLEGGVASRFFHALAPAQEVEFTGPMGYFVLQPSHPGDIVFGVTGTGLAPVVPMLERLAEREDRNRAIHLYWGLRRLEDGFYQDKIEAVANQLPRFTQLLCVTQPPPDFAAGRTGRITEPLLATLEQLERPTYYLVGNGAMVKEVSTLLQERGVDRKRFIRTEIFFK